MEVLHGAEAEANTTAEQPLRVIPLEVKAMVPVGASPVTVAVNVTGRPTLEGFALELRTVVEAALFTVCDNAALVLVW